jgi:hypothetical protein
MPERKDPAMTTPRICLTTLLTGNFTVLLLAGSAAAAEPIRLHPDNPHYFLFRGRPTILVTSGEHYGSVLNLDFDDRDYLDELHARGFNLTRTFCGSYREVPGSFGIIDNTLAPARGDFVCPWARSDVAGATGGGHKFDLEKWNPTYFSRLKGHLLFASKRDIVVELGLFCTLYDDKLWNANPMNAGNNRNGVGKVGRLEVYTLKEPALTAVQDALVHKIVTELKDFDNLYYEVHNEPYFGGVTREWTDHIIKTIVDTEAAFPARHLIAQNIANGSKKIERPNKSVSIFNFHYATPPDTVALNYGLNRVLADDETGFRGKHNLPYRTEGWDFLMAGGAVYSNLDYSFTCAHPDGTAVVTTSPGGGGPELRRQLQILKQFMESLPFITMKPDNSVIKGGAVTVPLIGTPPEGGATARALVKPGQVYAVYVRGGTQASLMLEMPSGTYLAEWINPRSGKVDKAEDFSHRGGSRTLQSPAYTEDIALRVKRR